MPASSRSAEGLHSAQQSSPWPPGRSAESACCGLPLLPRAVKGRPAAHSLSTIEREWCTYTKTKSLLGLYSGQNKTSKPLWTCGLPKWSRSGSNRRPLACHASPACRSTTNAFSTGGYAVLESCDLLQRLKGGQRPLPRELGLADDIQLEKLKLLRSGSAQRAGP